MRSAIVLVGGAASRAGGQEKYFFVYKGKTFIDRLLDTLRGIVDEILVVTKDAAQCERFSHLPDIKCVEDIQKGLGPIGGLYTGALHARGELVFVAACDMPCIDQNLVKHLFSLVDEYDAVIPCWNKEKLEPLHAVYRRSAVVDYLDHHDSHSLRAMVKNLKTRYVSVETIRRIDPNLSSFTNINKLDELAEINELERECDE